MEGPTAPEPCAAGLEAERPHLVDWMRTVTPSYEFQHGAARDTLVCPLTCRSRCLRSFEIGAASRVRDTYRLHDVFFSFFVSSLICFS
jgi:hypothetical protein